MIQNGTKLNFVTQVGDRLNAIVKTAGAGFQVVLLDGQPGAVVGEGATAQAAYDDLAQHVSDLGVAW